MKCDRREDSCTLSKKKMYAFHVHFNLLQVVEMVDKFCFRGFGFSWVSDPPKSPAPGTYKVAIFTLAGLLLNGFDWLQKLVV